MRLLVCIAIALVALSLSAFADDLATAVASPPAKLKISLRLYEVDTAAAVAAGLEDPTSAQDNRAMTVSFKVIPSTSIGRILEGLQAAGQGSLVMETEPNVLSGFPAGVSWMTPQMGRVDPDQSLPADVIGNRSIDFTGHYGIAFGYVPTVDEAGRILLTLHTVIRRPNDANANSGAQPRDMESVIESTLKVQSGATILMSGMLNEDDRRALHAVAEHPDTGIFRESKPGSRLYLVIQPELAQ